MIPLRAASARAGKLAKPLREGGLALALLRDAIGRSFGRFGLIVAMAVLTAALEAVALVTLPALLGMRGAPPPSKWSVLSEISLGPTALLAFYIGLVGIAAMLVYAQTMLSSWLTLDFVERLRMRLYASVLDARWGTDALSRPADLVHALTTEASQCAYATQTTIQLAARVVYLPSFLTAALILSPRLALAAILLAAAAGVPMLVLAQRAYALAVGVASANRRLHRDLADDFAGLKAIKTLRAEPARQKAFREQLDEMRGATLGQTRATAAVQAWQRFAAATAAAGGAIYGFTVLRLDGGAMLALAVALVRLASNASQALDLWRHLRRLLPVYEQFRACEARCRAVEEPPPAVNAPRLRRELRLRGVAFSYPGAPEPTLDSVDLTIPARSITVLTGPSGTGKSTLADLVMGLTAPTAGDILVDDGKLDGPTRRAWRNNVAYVPQEPFLFHATIRENLRLAKPHALDVEMRDALEAAAATFVLRLPEGLETIVGDRGTRLSGGERQRLMLARALLLAPDLLVLDEATNALDTIVEAEVIASLRRLAGTMTILVIAHRSAIVDAADRVLHLESGRVVLREKIIAP